MLIPLLVMAGAFKLFFLTVTLMRMRYEILMREKHTVWVADVVRAGR